MSTSPTDLLIENCRQLRRTAREQRELRHLYIKKAAEGILAMADGEQRDETLRRIFADAARDAGFPLELLLDTDEQIALCRALLSHREKASGKSREEQAEALPSPLRIALMPSAFADAALQRFAAVLPLHTTVQAASAAEACETVASDGAHLALLPIENSENGRLLHFHELIDRYELHVGMTAEVEYNDGTHTVRYALLYRSKIPFAAARGEETVECACSDRDGTALTALLAAALGCGMRLRRVDAEALPYRDDTFLFRPVFLTDGAAFALFSLYLSLFSPHVGVTEHYIHLT